MFQFFFSLVSPSKAFVAADGNTLQNASHFPPAGCEEEAEEVEDSRKREREGEEDFDENSAPFARARDGRTIERTTTYTGFGLSGAMNIANITDDHVRNFIGADPWLSQSPHLQTLLAPEQALQFSNALQALVDGKNDATGLWEALRSELDLLPKAFSLLRHVAMDVFFGAARAWYSHHINGLRNPVPQAVTWPRQSDVVSAMSELFASPQSLVNLFVQLCKRLACPGYNGTKVCARCRACQEEKVPKGSRRLVDHNNQPLPPGRTYFVWDCDGTGNVAEAFWDKSEEMEAKDTHKLQAWHEMRDKEIHNVPFQQGDPPRVLYILFI